MYGRVCQLLRKQPVWWRKHIPQDCTRWPVSFLPCYWWPLRTHSHRPTDARPPGATPRIGQGEERFIKVMFQKIDIDHKLLTTTGSLLISMSLSSSSSSSLSSGMSSSIYDCYLKISFEKDSTLCEPNLAPAPPPIAQARILLWVGHVVPSLAKMLGLLLPGE